MDATNLPAVTDQTTEQRRQRVPPASSWVSEYGDSLYRAAYSILHDRTKAEDLVQDTFVAALKGVGSYKGGAEFRTWLLSILRNKAIDQIRRQRREGHGSPVEHDELVDDAFDSRGGWRKPPAEWQFDPSSMAENREFWAVFRKCVGNLPARAAQAFTLRTITDVPSADVCKAMGIEPSNLWLILHRARVRLRGCLEVHWFGNANKGT